MLYQALKDWGFDGLTIADDGCMRNLQTQHKVASSQADAMQQWFNAGGMIDYYDWDLDSYLNVSDCERIVLATLLNIDRPRKIW